jgi:hypothetical protein
MITGEVPGSLAKEYEEERDRTLLQEPEEKVARFEEETGMASVLEKEGKKDVEEVAAGVSDDAPFVEAEAEEPAEEPEKEEIAVEEEPVIASMSESAQAEEDVMPIETFLEMEPSAAGIIEEQIDVPVVDQTEETAQRAVEREIAPEAEQVREEPEPAPAYGQEMESSAETAVPEYAGPEMVEGEPDEVVFDSGEAPQATDAIQETYDSSDAYAEETMVDRQLPESVLPPPPPYPTRPPDYKRDESVEPATILDIEAETIIADRNEILGKKKKKPSREEPAKGTLGITGDDISDQLDNFFNIK